MTENEAIEFMKRYTDADCYTDKCISAHNIAINALEEIQKYRTIEKKLKEKYHANVDIPLLMQYFIETVFEGEKHDGFCLLTNEDREVWEEYKSIGSPEECRKAVFREAKKE